MDQKLVDLRNSKKLGRFRITVEPFGFLFVTASLMQVNLNKKKAYSEFH